MALGIQEGSVYEFAVGKEKEPSFPGEGRLFEFILSADQPSTFASVARIMLMIW